MSHRHGRASRRPSTPDLRLLVVGIVLTVAGFGMSTCEPLQDVLSGSPAADRGPQPGGVQP